jgi:hypothetical protein
VALTAILSQNSLQSARTAPQIPQRCHLVLTIFWDLILHLRICATHTERTRSGSWCRDFRYRRLHQGRGMICETTGCAPIRAAPNRHHEKCVVRFATVGDDGSPCRVKTFQKCHIARLNGNNDSAAQTFLFDWRADWTRPITVPSAMDASSRSLPSSYSGSNGQSSRVEPDKTLAVIASGESPPS